MKVVETFWGAAAPDPATVLEGDHEADVAVVGGGLAGMSTAWFLKQADPDLRVALLEREYLGYGASTRNFGNVPQLTHQEVPYLLQLLGPEGVGFVARHQARMLDEYEALISEQGVDCGFARLPVLYPALRAEHVQGLREIAELHRRFGIPSRLLGPEEVWLECRLQTHGGLSVERNGTVQPFRRARGFADALGQLGVAAHEGSAVEGWEETRDGVRLRTARGTLAARRAVFATNAYTSLLGVGEGAISATYSYVLATERLDRERLEAVGWSGRHAMLVDAGPLDEHFYLRVVDERFLIGGGARATYRLGSLPPHHDPAFHDRLVLEMGRRFPALEGAAVEFAWGGPLGMTGSRLPVMAQVSEHCFLNGGFNGRGALLAALSGRVMVGLVLGEGRADPDYLRFGRLLFQRERVAPG